MKNFNYDNLKSILDKVEEIPEGSKYPKPIYPLQWLISCGWDKISYDEYLTKYTAGTIVDTNELKCFELIYHKMLLIIAGLEQASAHNGINYNYYRLALEYYGGSGLVSSKQQKTIKERVDKYKEQQALKNDSGIEIK